MIECHIDYNRDFKTPDEIMNDKLMTQEQKANELQKISYLKEYHQTYNVKFNSLL